MASVGEKGKPKRGNVGAEWRLPAGWLEPRFYGNNQTI